MPIVKEGRLIIVIKKDKQKGRGLRGEDLAIAEKFAEGPFKSPVDSIYVEYMSREVDVPSTLDSYSPV